MGTWRSPRSREEFSRSVPAEQEVAFFADLHQSLLGQFRRSGRSTVSLLSGGCLKPGAAGPSECPLPGHGAWSTDALSKLWDW